ncbi:hypothetical protein [Bosea sp. (in: a-proteobacteria)]|jgi:uncharacterized protein YraI|uniref:hypothetical protein n=1 Tax=Bosea sp. (in: a-proteobacteria) TaxID=1871050 RepID=UPI001DA04366|nr:hypothetical protein [Bosea sp. (in: a-proteobacteria)]MBA4223917.1 hypothetical protein [Methylobacterium sp.]MBR3191118.1 hypothetical protein [Bosea sp. (in: a-proteobacteria)]
MKRLIPALVATLLASGTAYAQSINIGPGGISVDPRTPHQRAVDREIRHEERMRERDRWERRREMERRRAWRDERRGERCRTVTTTEETRRGLVKRTTRVCD